MEKKTKVKAEEGKQELLITREFDLPLELLFKAYEEPEIVEQWMGTKVLKMENKRHGAYRFETTDPKGNVHGFNGTIHEFESQKKITRTFEMESAPHLGIQLEFLEFEEISAETSKLSMHIIYRSVDIRDQVLQMPFAQGINMAHGRLEKIVKQLLN
ncbi:SRPBCC domain-containing protein [Marinilongibacter aquaticus]|uniref:SRPBCC family protein n=1 Tax=Marinilongibacter aquaticus TaxID=2975157 RepID=UPI0021BD2764|nr:SRPBCC domain-containing protein [Marinilongibacter aquaticus]UBM59538.1 SRPBCC domain-containing protein [Marinilongibacter aquaticus]